MPALKAAVLSMVDISFALELHKLGVGQAIEESE